MVEKIQENIKRMGKEGVKMLKNSESTIERLSNLLSAFSDVNKGEELITSQLFLL